MKEDIIRIVAKQEELVRFSKPDLAMLDSIGRKIHDWAVENDKRLYIMIRVNGFVVYASGTGDISPNNKAWAERKSRLAELHWKSSLRVTLETERDPRSLEELGLNYSDYGLSGGSFPILLESGLCIGSITASGLKGEEDHQLVVNAICQVLGIEVPGKVADI